jgi:hypothetical protein
MICHSTFAYSDLHKFFLLQTKEEVNRKSLLAHLQFFLSSMEIPKWMEGWSGLLERIHWPLPLSEDLIAHDPT